VKLCGACVCSDEEGLGGIPYIVGGIIIEETCDVIWLAESC